MKTERERMSSTGGGFLRAAAMKRVDMKIRNEKETLGRPLLFCRSLDASQLERSGLNVLESAHLSRWVAGRESGRHCLLALLECHRMEADLRRSSKQTTDAPARFSDHRLLMSGAEKSSIQLSALGKSICLPDEFLCDSGLLYKSVFSKPPSAVLKEGLKILARFANEKSSTALTTDQINLGLKQIRMEKMIEVTSTGSPPSLPEKENVDNENSNNDKASSEKRKYVPSPDSDDGSSGKSIAEAYRLQIIVELLRQHIIKSTSEADESGNTSNDRKHHSRKNGTRKKVVPKIERLFDPNLSLDQHYEEANEEVDDLESSLNLDEDIGLESNEKATEGFTLYSIQPLRSELEKQLHCSKEKHIEEAETLTDAQLMESNRMLLPYISQLMAMKSSLGDYVDFLDGSKAYLSFGLDKNCDAAALKKAYRSKAVKLHPDKKGGDKAKFQQLNDMYNEILKVKLEESAVSEEIESEWLADGETINRAQSVLTKVEGYVVDIKNAATTCAALAQTSLRWKKKIDKAGNIAFPKGIKRLFKLMKPAATGDELDIMTPKASSCLLAEEHLQIISVTVSLMVSELMTLMSLGRYGSATGKNVHLLKNIEYLATSGLNVQKIVPSLSPVETQIDSLLPRAELSFELSQTDAGVHDVLVQMFCTSFHTRHLTLGMAADACVTVALAAGEICLAVRQVIKECDTDFKNELKRNAKHREQESDMCDEDKAFMAAMAQEQQEACNKQAREKETKKKEEEEKHREDGTEMEYLRGQVHSLQVQLRLQNMEALQTMNADVCEMQRKVQNHVSEVVVLDTMSESKETHDGIGERCNKSSTESAPTSLDLQSKSLFSLLGELVDGSCLNYINNANTDSPLVLTSSMVDNPIEVIDIFEGSFGWMFALRKRCSDEFQDEDESESQEDCTEGSQSQKRLALYPDFRSKVLWICAHLNHVNVRALISDEFHPRLVDCIRGSTCVAPFLGDDSKKIIDAEDKSGYQGKVASAICDFISEGIDAAVLRVQ